VTAVLLERLEATPGARIVSTASDAYKAARLNFDDLQSSRGYGAFGAYGRSKLMNVLFTRLLARRLAGTGVTANCHHPGFVATRFGDSGSGFMNLVLQTAKRFALTPEQGAQTMIYLASSPEAAQLTGSYFYKCRPAKLMRQARNDADAQRLWDISAQLSGVGA
jgi:NAD(P)-dependent dehydrogenase (short-subunit alcohol dehydrogenase family)